MNLRWAEGIDIGRKMVQFIEAHQTYWQIEGTNLIWDGHDRFWTIAQFYNLEALQWKI